MINSESLSGVRREYNPRLTVSHHKYISHLTGYLDYLSLHVLVFTLSRRKFVRQSKKKNWATEKALEALCNHPSLVFSDIICIVNPFVWLYLNSLLLHFSSCLS